MIRRLAWLAAVLPALVLAAGAPAYEEAYARDRAEIEDLSARYVFALNWQDADAYASTFTEDGVLDWAGGVVKGREAIRAEVRNMRAYFARREQAEAPTRPARLRHFVTNRIIKVEGERATSVAYWVEFNNDGRERWPYVGAYGHFEDELRKVDGRWLIARHVIYNEQMAARAAPPVNPAPH